MTVAIAVKVFDGIVLAADSASTMSLAGGQSQVYNNANKIFQLHRHQPVGAMTWGLAQIGSASIATLAKDLRRRLMGQDTDHTDWELNEGYTIKDVADRLVEMMFHELYAPEFAGVAPAPVLGFHVAGFSGGEKKAEGWTVILSDPTTPPVPVCAAAQDLAGWFAFGQPEAVSRLTKGWDPSLLPALQAIVPPASHPALHVALNAAERSLVVASMPFADAINLARFLVDTTVGYSRFSLGPDTVGGPVEIAGISRHEGFKWISRKHYYPLDLNPEDPHR